MKISFFFSVFSGEEKAAATGSTVTTLSVIFSNTDLDDVLILDANGVGRGRGVSRKRFLLPSGAWSARQDTRGEGETKKSNLSNFGLSGTLLLSLLTVGAIFKFAKQVSR